MPVTAEDAARETRTCAKFYRRRTGQYAADFIEDWTGFVWLALAEGRRADSAVGTEISRLKRDYRNRPAFYANLNPADFLWHTEDRTPDESWRQRVHRIVGDVGQLAERIVLMRFEDDMTTEEIAERIGVSVNDARTHLKRAMRVLRRAVRMGEWNGKPFTDAGGK